MPARTTTSSATSAGTASTVQTFDSGTRGSFAGLTSGDWVTRDDMAALTRKTRLRLP